MSRSFAEQGLKIRIRKEIRPKKTVYYRPKILAGQNTEIYTGRESSSEISTSSSIESISTGVVTRHSLPHHLDATKQTNFEHYQNVSDPVLNAGEQSTYRTTLINKKLTEQEEYAQSGLMLLASLPFQAPESPPTPSGITPSLTITGNYSYYQHCNTRSNSTSTPLGEKFSCPLSRPISTVTIPNLYDCHHAGSDLFKNLTMIPSSLLVQKNLMT